ncbi:hypothetical protein Acsp07_07330 [Actinomycetospora sp. NBRC 106378]|nr:hypothetical protein Acsp07_07330 [Actinomycetospora sp. NBRC 106378]
MPPQVTPVACCVEPPELLSLPHALNRSAPAAIMPIAAARRWNLTEISRLVHRARRRDGEPGIPAAAGTRDGRTRTLGSRGGRTLLTG